MSPTNIAVFDFDWSLIEEDSDYWTIHSLSPEVWEEVREKRRQDWQWTDLMDFALCRLQDKGFTRDDIVAVLKDIPFSFEMRNVLLDLKRKNVHVILMSDANTFYIDTILKAYGVQDCVTEIITNPSYTDEQGRLRIRRHVLATETPHNCTNPCSVNICKGQEMDALLKRYKQQGHDIQKIAYTGDGKNDFCPATRLRHTDTFFMRKEKGLDRYLSQVPEEKNRIQSQFVYWLKPESVWESMPKYFSSVSA
ncbi:phosphatase phospho-type [Mucor mucedo]|uniref:phosphatase phospho-type n=1 Tax=Mucor mucedo TaxID=29922 RepID=UPI00221EC0EC|nr:phosphatase phospho-type [Mucor mucedo]KAI7892444.1 phosphatase phospho-type [Mucor mucedo]